MTFFAAGVYIPLRHGVAGSTDWTVIAGLVVVMAIVLTALIVGAYRSVNTPPVSESEPRDSVGKAA